MDRAIHGCEKAKIGGISPLEFSGQNARAFMEHRKASSFFHLNQHVTSEGLVYYKQTFAIDSSIAHLFFEARTLFLIREAHEGVMFLMRRSLCTPKQQ
jgi:hypothetical protein